MLSLKALTKRDHVAGSPFGTVKTNHAAHTFAHNVDLLRSIGLINGVLREKLLGHLDVLVEMEPNIPLTTRNCTRIAPVTDLFRPFPDWGTETSIPTCHSVASVVVDL